MSTHNLVAFDFDETLVDCNADEFVKHLCPDSKIPDNVRNVFDGKNNWTQYMAALFRYIFECGCKESDYRDLMIKMPFVPGMKDLILNLKTKCNGDTLYDLIIISDANDFFINLYLTYHQLRGAFSKVFTNRANFDDFGCLHIEGYHDQDYCKNSSRNLCKGQILLDYLNEQHAEGVCYNQVIYVGDGGNDICPASKLSTNDEVFYRKGYGFETMMMKSSKLGKPIKLCANLHSWITGHDIMEKLLIHLFVKPFPKMQLKMKDGNIVPPTPPPSPADALPQNSKRNIR